MAIEGLGPQGPQRTPTTPVPARPAAPPPPLPETPAPAGDRPELRHRPPTDAERQQAAIAAVQEARAQEQETKPADPASPPVPKVAADAVGVADGVRTGVKIATNADELRSLPVVGKLAQRGGRIGAIIGSFPGSKLGRMLSTLVESNRFIAPAGRFLGRVAPFAGVVVGGYDVWDATRTHHDPKAPPLEKNLATTKAVFSSLAGLAGVAALALAPTGLGAVIAGGVAIGAGLLAFGTDLILGRVRKARQDRGSRA